MEQKMIYSFLLKTSTFFFYIDGFRNPICKNDNKNSPFSISVCVKRKNKIPVDTGRKLNVNKAFRRRPGRLLNVLCTFNLRPVSMGIIEKRKTVKSSLETQVFKMTRLAREKFPQRKVGNTVKVRIPDVDCRRYDSRGILTVIMEVDFTKTSVQNRNER